MSQLEGLTVQLSEHLSGSVRLEAVVSNARVPGR
jgi:hypothetical protein